MMTLWRRLISLRLNRRSFWAGMVLMVLGTIALERVWPGFVNGGFALPWLLLHGWRLHDFGYRALWAWGAITGALFLLSALAILQPAGTPDLTVGAIALATFVGLCAFTLWVGLKRGDAGPNRFNPAREA